MQYESRERRTYARVPRAKSGISQLPVARTVRSTGRATRVDAIHHAQQRACDYDGVHGQDGDRRGTKIYAKRRRSQSSGMLGAKSAAAYGSSGVETA
jgi:hypothetical protein